MAALLAANIAVPAFFWFAGITALPLAFIGAAVLFLPLFVFLPRIIRYAMKADTDAVLDAFGKNEQVKKVLLECIHHIGRHRAGGGGGPGDGTADPRGDHRNRDLISLFFEYHDTIYEISLMGNLQ
ncbi:MAG: hypothetical protein WC379_04165 [Methanoregula sp.]|jgi:hypothetical protein